MQMPRPTCKACGAVLGGQAPRPMPEEQKIQVAAQENRKQDAGAKNDQFHPPHPRTTLALMYGLLVVGGLLLAGILWYGIQSTKQPGPGESVLSGSQSPAASQVSPLKPMRPLPSVSEAERRSAYEAVQALKALQSVTRAGVTYNEYLPRVLDAKIQVV